MKSIYNIPIENINMFKKRIEQLNKKALKLNLEPIKLNILDTFVYDSNVSLDIPCYRIEIIQKENIGVNGYEFVGKLEKNIENTFIYKGKKGVPASQKEIKTCQHCNSNRLRKLLYILQNENGEYITVGKTCLNDFIKHGDAEKIAQYYQIVEDLFLTQEDEFLEEFLSDKSYTPSTYSIDDVIRASVVSIKDRGYHKSSEDFSTKEDVYGILHIKNERYKKLFNDAMQIPKQEIDDIKEFILNMDSDIDFINNLKLLINDGFIIDKMLGYAVSIPHTVSIEKAKLIREELNNQTASESEFIGAIGDKIEALATFTHCSSYTRFSDYTGRPETVNIYNFLDENNNCITWKTTVDEDFEVGDKVVIKGKVKYHNEYKGIKQTTLTRATCKFVDGNYSSKHLGSISEELTLKVKCVKATANEITDTVYTYEFLNNKNCILWNTTTQQNINTGDNLSIRGKVKAHNIYKGTKQTLLQDVVIN